MEHSNDEIDQWELQIHQKSAIIWAHSHAIVNRMKMNILKSFVVQECSWIDLESALVILMTHFNSMHDRIIYLEIFPRVSIPLGIQGEVDLPHVLFTLFSIWEDVCMWCKIKSHLVHIKLSKEFLTEIARTIVEYVELNLIR